MKSHFLTLLAVASVAGVLSQRAEAATMVGLELSLLVDTSGSVSTSEWKLQRDGYVAAFQSPTIHALITSLASQSGGLAVNYIQWDSTPTQSVGWTLLTDAASSNAFAAAILAAPRDGSAGTGLANAVNFAYPLFATNGYDGLRQVIDVSGDGRDNRNAQGGSIGAAQGAINTAAARDAALAAGIDRINTLPILGEAGLLAFYQNNLQGGTNSFTLPVDNFESFGAAIQKKLEAEIKDTTPNPVPEGGSVIAVLGAALFGLAGLRSRLASRR